MPKTNNHQHLQPRPGGMLTTRSGLSMFSPSSQHSYLNRSNSLCDLNPHKKPPAARRGSPALTILSAGCHLSVYSQRGAIPKTHPSPMWKHGESRTAGFQSASSLPPLQNTKNVIARRSAGPTRQSQPHDIPVRTKSHFLAPRPVRGVRPPASRRKSCFYQTTTIPTCHPERSRRI